MWGMCAQAFTWCPIKGDDTSLFRMSSQFSNLNVNGSPLLDVPLQNYCEGIEAATLLPLAFPFQREGQYLVFNELEIHGTIRVSASVVEGRTLYCAMN